VDAALLTGQGGGLELVGDEELPDGLSRAVTDALLAAPVEQRLLDPPPPDEGLAVLLSIGFSLLFFFTVFVFGLQIAQSVVEEKQRRVVELLVAAVPVRLLLAGKVAGNTALALAQIVLLVGVAMVGSSVAGQARLLGLLLAASGWFLLFFLLGFTMLACLWAVAGAVASRQEELQSTTLPLQMLVMLPFFASIYITEPGPALTVLSYLPVSSPLVMPRRILLGEVSAWEPLLAAAIIAVTAVLLVRVAARLYEGSLLRTGTRTTLSQAWSSGRS
jgi:ABC-2 type transport system permease protein